MGLVDYQESDEESNASLDDQVPEFKQPSIPPSKPCNPSPETPSPPSPPKQIKYADKVENFLKMRVPKGASKVSSSLLDKKSLFSLPSVSELDSSDDSDDDKKLPPSRKILSGDRRSLLDILPKTSDPDIYKPSLVPKQAKKAPETVLNQKITTEDLVLTEKIDLKNDEFFSFYDAEKESEELSKITPVQPLFTKPLVPQKKPEVQIIGPQIMDPSSIGAEYLLPRSGEELKPGQKLLDTKDSEMFEGYNIEGFWNEESLIPGPEKKRAKLARETALAKDKGLKELLEILPTRVVDQTELTKGFQAEMMKNITKDTVQYYEAPKQKAPSHQASRKNQITSLAFNAQEYEMDLKDKWASAKGNRDARRNKYGF